MTEISVANVVQKANISNLPTELQLAQKSIELPEVQEMIRNPSKVQPWCFYAS